MGNLKTVFFALVVVILGWRLRTGYLRSRAEWTRESWRAFARVAIIASLPLGVALGMAVAVDLGIYEAVSATPTFRWIWVGAMFASMFIGIVLVMATLNRFEQAAPTRDLRDLFRPIGTRNGDRAA